MTAPYSVFALLYVAAAVISAAVGLFILLRNPTSRVFQSFFSIIAAGLLWTTAYAIELMEPSDRLPYGCLRVLYLGVPFISPCFFWFVTEWTQAKRIAWIRKTGFGLATLLAGSAFVFADKLFDFRVYWWGRNDVPKETLVAHVFMGILFFVFFFYGFLACVFIWRAMKKTTGIRKSQYRTFLFAVLIGYTGFLDFGAVIGIDLPPYGSISFIFFIGLIAYAILKHQFLDVNLFLKKASLVLVVYAFLFSLTLPVLSRLRDWFVPKGESAAPFFVLSFGLAAVLSLGPFFYAWLVRRSFWLRTTDSTGLTHELRSPVAAIHGATEFLANALGKGELEQAAARDYVRMIQTNTERLDELIKDLLALSKIENQDTSNLEFKDLDVGLLVQSCVRRYESLAHIRGNKIVIEAPGECFIRADAEKLDQVLSNLISNAIRFTEKGTILIRYRVEEGEFRLSVKDSGIGISDEALPYVFNRFYKVSANSKGTGIGLTIAKAWIEAHGGEIRAESAGDNRGATILFSIPSRTEK